MKSRSTQYFVIPPPEQCGYGGKRELCNLQKITCQKLKMAASNLSWLTAFLQLDGRFLWKRWFLATCHD